MIGKFFRNRRIRKLKREFDSLFQKVENLTKESSHSMLEFGNLRKAQDWVIENSNTLTCKYELDLLSDRPMQYTIVYDFLSKELSCYSKMGTKSNVGNALQFKTKSIKELNDKVLDIARHIPSLRSRMIKEYLFALTVDKPRRRWLKFFIPRLSRERRLMHIIDELRQNGKISDQEANNARTYVLDLEAQV